MSTRAVKGCLTGTVIGLIIWGLIFLFLSGCASWTPEQKKAAWIFAGFVATSYALSRDNDSPTIQQIACDGFVLIPIGPQIPGQPATFEVQQRFC